MKPFKSVLSLLAIGCAAIAVTGSTTEPQTTAKNHQEMAIAIQQRITTFHSELPPSAHDKKMRLIYFIGSDGVPQPRYRERISGWFADYNRFFKDEFSRNGFGKLEMNLEYEADSMLKLWMVRGKKKSADYTPRSGHEIANEIKTALAENFNLDAETAMIIAGLSETPDSVTAKLWSPYHGFGYFESTRGLGIAVDHEFLDVAHLGDTSTQVTAVEHGARKMSLGMFNTTYIGGFLHEMGHCLTYPHNRATKEEEYLGIPLMGSGNYSYRGDLRGQKKTFIPFAEAAVFVTQPVFSRHAYGKVKGGKMALADLTVDTASQKDYITLSGRIISDFEPYLLNLYLDENSKPYEKAFNDYKALPMTTVIGKDRIFKVTFPVSQLPNNNGRILFGVFFLNGMPARVDFSPAYFK